MAACALRSGRSRTCRSPPSRRTRSRSIPTAARRRTLLIAGDRRLRRPTSPCSTSTTPAEPPTEAPSATTSSPGTRRRQRPSSAAATPSPTSCGTGYATVVAGDVVRLSTSNPVRRRSAIRRRTTWSAAGYSTTDSDRSRAAWSRLVRHRRRANSVTVDTTGLPTGAGLGCSDPTLFPLAGRHDAWRPAPIPTPSRRPRASPASCPPRPPGAIIINNYDTSRVTIAAPILDNSATAITLNGPGTTVLSGNNQYSGITTISTDRHSSMIADPGLLGGRQLRGRHHRQRHCSNTAPSVLQTLAGVISGPGRRHLGDGTSGTLGRSAGPNTSYGADGSESRAPSPSTASASAAHLVQLCSSSAIRRPTAGSVTLQRDSRLTPTPNPISVVGVNQVDTIQTNVRQRHVRRRDRLGRADLSPILSAADRSVPSTDTGGASGTGNLVLSNNNTNGSGTGHHRLRAARGTSPAPSPTRGPEPGSVTISRQPRVRRHRSVLQSPDASRWYLSAAASTYQGRHAQFRHHSRQPAFNACPASKHRRGPDHERAPWAPDSSLALLGTL